MYNFFIDVIDADNQIYKIQGNDFNHIKNVLRMKIGEKFLVSHDDNSDLCQLEEYFEGFATAKIIERDYQNTNLPVEIYLFQGLPKSDKLELIIQKAVELGAHEIIPVQMARSIVKYDDKKKQAKRERYQAIAESAAKQSKRSYIPTVSQVKTYSDAMEKAKTLDLFLVPYESTSGMAATKNALSLIKKGMKVGVLIGPEGGFEYSEIERAQKAGGKIISLGSRILRAETAAISTVSMLMLYIEMNV